MVRFLRLLCFMIPSALLPFSAAAQETLGVRQAVELAFRNSPVLRMAERRVEVTQGLLEQSRLMRSPRFLLQTENLRTSDFNFAQDTDTYALLSQVVEMPGKRAARIAVADSSFRRERLQKELTQRELALAVKNAYWRAVAAERTRELLQENLDGMQSLVDYHVARVNEGAMAEADLLRVRLERERLQIDATAATLEAERARIDLFREMGVAHSATLKLTGELETDPVPELGRSVEYALEHRQEMLQARAALEGALASARLERATARPDVDFIGGYKRTGGNNTAVVGLSLDLPLFNRNQGNVHASTAAVHEAESGLQAVRTSVEAEVLAAEADFAARKKQVSGTLRLIREHAIETSRIAHAAYQEGGIDLLRLIDSERIRIDSQLLYFRALAQYQQSYANLENAMGVTQ